MVLSTLEKIGLAIKSLFSSFMSIELLVIALLLFIFLFINLKKEEKIIKVVAVFLYILFFFIISFFYSTYTKESIDGVLKYIMNYIYFPSLAMYFMIIVFTTIAIVYTMFSKKMTIFLKRVNIIVFSILYLFYIQVIGLVASNNINLSTSIELYKNENILALVQVSNLLLVVWFIFIIFYKLFKYLKRRFDNIDSVE